MSETKPTAEKTYPGNFPKWQEDLREILDSRVIPLREKREELKAFIKKSILSDNGACLMQGETGSGKSLVTPQLLHECLGELIDDGRWTRGRKIIVLQPRRDAAENTARGVAALGNLEMGRDVGFTTRDGKQGGKDTDIMCVTPGILKRYIQEGILDDNDLGAIMLDEIHMETEEYEIIMSLLRNKVVDPSVDCPFVFLTTATPDSEKLLKHFSLTPEDFHFVEGRTFPVTSEFDSTGSEIINPESVKRPEITGMVTKAAAIVREQLGKSPNETGDILVFMPGKGEIASLHQEVRNYIDLEDDSLEVLPLHGDLDKSVREYVLFDKRPARVKRRIIISTDIAEASVTVPNIGTVIDSGLQRSSRFNPQKGLSEMITHIISQAQAIQRAGRAGREREGRCIRLYSEINYSAMRPFNLPSIQLADLSQSVLFLYGIKEDPKTFRFINPPEPDRVARAIADLQLVGALDSENNLTHLGRQMNQIPFEPRLAAMFIRSAETGHEEFCAAMIASLREQSILRRNPSLDVVAARRGLIKKGGIVSDQHMILSIIADGFRTKAISISNGRVVKGSSWNKGETDFYHWCKKYGVDSNYIFHALVRLRDYMRYIGNATKDKKGGIQGFNTQKFLDQFDAITSADYTRILYAGYPDEIHACMTKSTRRSTWPVLESLSGKGSHAYGRESLLLENDMAGFPLAFALEVISISGHTYASNITGIKLEDLLGVLPARFVTETAEGIAFLAGTPAARSTVVIDIGATGTNQFKLTKETPLDVDQVSLYFARTLYESPNNFGYGNTIVKEPGKALAKIQQLNIRTGGRYTEMINQFQGVVMDHYCAIIKRKDLSSVNDITTDMTNNPEDWQKDWFAHNVSATVHETVLQEFPDTIEFSGVSANLVYKQSLEGKYFTVCSLGLSEFLSLASEPEPVGKNMVYTVVGQYGSSLLSQSEAPYSDIRRLAMAYYKQQQLSDDSQMLESLKPATDYKPVADATGATIPTFAPVFWKINPADPSEEWYVYPVVKPVNFDTVTIELCFDPETAKQKHEQAIAWVRSLHAEWARQTQTPADVLSLQTDIAGTLSELQPDNIHNTWATAGFTDYSQAHGIVSRLQSLQTTLRTENSQVAEVKIKLIQITSELTAIYQKNKDAVSTRKTVDAFLSTELAARLDIAPILRKDADSTRRGVSHNISFGRQDKWRLPRRELLDGTKPLNDSGLTPQHIPLLTVYAKQLPDALETDIRIVVARVAVELDSYGHPSLVVYNTDQAIKPDYLLTNSLSTGTERYWDRAIDSVITECVVEQNSMLFTNQKQEIDYYNTMREQIPVGPEQSMYDSYSEDYNLSELKIQSNLSGYACGPLKLKTYSLPDGTTIQYWEDEYKGNIYRVSPQSLYMPDPENPDGNYYTAVVDSEYIGKDNRERQGMYDNRPKLYWVILDRPLPQYAPETAKKPKKEKNLPAEELTTASSLQLWGDMKNAEQHLKDAESQGNTIAATFAVPSLIGLLNQLLDTDSLSVDQRETLQARLEELQNKGKKAKK